MSRTVTSVAVSSVSEYQTHVGFERGDPRGTGAVLAGQSLRILAPMRSQLRGKTVTMRTTGRLAWMRGRRWCDGMLLLQGARGRMEPMLRPRPQG